MKSKANVGVIWSFSAHLFERSFGAIGSPFGLLNFLVVWSC